jgi:MinD-like ATPase involved in chromosome partitioning or flagellar assembly/CheY-like chemotaxis protein
VVIDPDAAAREEVRGLLSAGGIAVIGHAGYGPEALKVASATSPGVLVVAARGLPERVVVLLERLRAALPATPILLYGMPSLAAEAMAAGARACLPDRPGDRLLEAIARVLAAEERIRRYGDMPPQGGTALAIVSARGGVGKTTIAAGLAAAFSVHLGLAAVLVDTDPYGGAAGLLPRERGAPSVLSAASLEDTPGLAAAHDWVVIDTPAGLREEALKALELCDLAVIVTSPDVAVLKEHVRALRQLADWGFPHERLLVAVDRVHPSHRAPAGEVAQALDHPVAADIPYDSRLRRLADEGITPVLARPSSAAARAIIAFARTLAGLETTSAHRGGLLRRLVRVR